MKRLVKLVVAAVVIAVIVRVVRDRLVPAPQEPSAQPSGFRVAPEPAAPPAPPAAAPVPAATPAATAGEPAPAAAHHVADLTEVKGIGPVYFGRLVDAGITTLQGLATASAADVAGWAGVTEEAAADWIAQARRLAG